MLALIAVAYEAIAWAEPAPAPAATTANVRDLDEAFRAAATAIALRDQRYVWSWGTMHLDQTARAIRFAELQPQEMNGTADPRGAFLIEQAPGALWLITFRIRVRGIPEKIDPPPAPPWSRLDAIGIHHKYHFFNGHESVDLALRGGKPVVLRYEYDADYTHEFALYVVRDYAKAGCTPRCPAVADYPFREAALHVAGPAPSIDRLVDVETPAFGIDWPQLALRSDADALAVWRRMALANDDTDLVWQIPEGPWRLPLATALLHGGNFTCPAARLAPTCRSPRARPPAALGDPCARLGLASWALWIVRQSDESVAGVADVLRAIVRQPASNGVLVKAALDAAERDPALHKELLATAWRSRPLQREELLPVISRYDGDGAFLDQLVGKPPGANADCTTIAVAAWALDQKGRPSLDPVLPRTGGVSAMMRALCVLESYRELHGTGGDPRASFITDEGLELTWFHYLRYPDDRDRDGDGDPRTRRVIETVPGPDVDLPDDLAAALGHCSGTTCLSAMHIYRFVFTAAPDGGLRLGALEVRSRPPCDAP